MVGPAAIKYHQLPSICITFLQSNSTSCEGISGSVRAGAVASLGSPRNGKTSGCDRVMLMMIDHDFIGHWTFFGTLPVATDLPFSVFCRGHSHTQFLRGSRWPFSHFRHERNHYGTNWHHGIMNTLVDFMGSPWITYFPTCGSHRKFASVRLKKAGFQGKIKKLPGNLDRCGSFPLPCFNIFNIFNPFWVLGSTCCVVYSIIINFDD